MAEMAELDSDVNFNSYYYLGIKISGFRDSFKGFTNQYLKQILEFVPKDQQVFETLKEKQTKEYANFFLNVPYQLAYNSIIRALREGGSINPAQRLREIKSITLQDVAAFAQQWSKKVYMEFYMTGNLSEADAKQMA